MKPLSLFILIGSLLALAGCDTDKKPSEEITKPESSEVTWDWSSFPKSSEITLQTQPVDIQPKQSVAIYAESSGTISLKLADKVSLVAKDQVFAQMDIVELSEQEERLRIQEERARLDEVKEELLTRPEEQKKAREEIEEARRKVKILESVLNNPAMKKMAGELFNGDVGGADEKTLQDARDALELAERKLAWNEIHGDNLQEGLKRLQEMDMRKSRRQFEESSDRSSYVIPFEGELRIELNYIEGQRDYNVSSRELIATLNDYDEIHALLEVSNSSWINVSPQRLYVQLQDRDRTILEFRDDRIEKDERTRREVRKYVFATTLEGNESLKRLTGTQMKADLVYKLPELCHIVPKYELSLYALGKSQSTEWPEMVEAIWPGAKVLAEGLSNLAISYQQ